MKKSNFKLFIFLCFIVVSFHSYGQSSVIEEKTIPSNIDPYSDLSTEEALAYMEINEMIIDHCFDFTHDYFEGKYQAILRELENSEEYRSRYEKLLFIIDDNCPDGIIEFAREGYEKTIPNKPNQIKYWMKINEDKTIDFEYRHTLD